MSSGRGCKAPGLTELWDMPWLWGGRFLLSAWKLCGNPAASSPGLWYPGQLPAHTMLLCIFKCAPPNRPNRLPIPLGTGLEERIVGWKNSCLCPVRRVHVYRTQPGQQCAWLCWNGLL